MSQYHSLTLSDGVSDNNLPELSKLKNLRTLNVNGYCDITADALENFLVNSPNIRKIKLLRNVDRCARLHAIFQGRNLSIEIGSMIG